MDDRDLIIRPETYEILKDKYEARINAMVRYCTNDQVCRSRQLISYFGEHNGEDCGECDVCRSNKTKAIDPDKFDEAFDDVYKLLSSSPLRIEELCDNLGVFEEVLIRKVVYKMIGEDIAFVNDDRAIQLREEE